MLNQLVVQLAIAIQQAQYHKLQTLNTELKAKMQESTSKFLPPSQFSCR
ncbi:MAG: hypothetical protein V7K48_12475 [Nostoc sp.]